MSQHRERDGVYAGEGLQRRFDGSANGANGVLGASVGLKMRQHSGCQLGDGGLPFHGKSLMRWAVKLLEKRWMRDGKAWACMVRPLSGALKAR